MILDEFWSFLKTHLLYGFKSFSKLFISGWIESLTSGRPVAFKQIAYPHLIALRKICKFPQPTS